MKGGSVAQRGSGSKGLPSVLARRVAAGTSVDGPSERFMRTQRPLWDWLTDHYFRVEIDGWERLPEAPALLIGVHAGAALTADAWAFVYAWYRRFGRDRILHGTAHDVLMALPGLGGYFKASGVIPASRDSVTAALAAGHDVMVWPGGEEDSMRSWRRRDEVVLAGRKGFVRQAIRSGVPIVPVATTGGADTVFVLSEGRWLANAADRFTGLKDRLRGVTLPIVAGFPFGIYPELVPAHLPLPAKLRYEILEPVTVDTDPSRESDDDYVEQIYGRVERALQDAVDDLAARRSFPVLG
jgi:1-acyl-sn-glycerol-3-phosphate acyltransferase